MSKKFENVLVIWWSWVQAQHFPPNGYLQLFLSHVY